MKALSFILQTVAFIGMMLGIMSLFSILDAFTN